MLCSHPLRREKPKGLLRAISRLSAAFACDKHTVEIFQKILVAAEKRAPLAGVCCWLLAGIL